MAGPSTGAASCPAADRPDEKVAQFSDRQSLYNAPVFVIENQAALAIDLRAAAIRLWTSLLLRNRKVTTNVIQPPARGPVAAPLVADQAREIIRFCSTNYSSISPASLTPPLLRPPPSPGFPARANSATTRSKPLSPRSSITA